ncbi:MAG TPA: aspartate kinase [bacterium]|nr:aspartate kinase [bacterium]
MSVLVQKYGGQCVATPALIKQVARKVIEARRAGYSVLVVMSAMGNSTNDLISFAHEVSTKPSPRELDMLITVGERISISLLSMAISDLGFDSISFTGSQSGIITTGQHNRARIVDVRPGRIVDSLKQGKIVIVAGFQGVSQQKEITTLGRGGSDLTAVVLAKALAAQRCELRKGVPGVMSADPNVVPDARLLDVLSAEKLLELSCAGASVVHRRAAQFVCRERLPVLICSGISEGRGTRIVSENKMKKRADSAAASGECPEATSLDSVVSCGPVCSISVDFIGDGALEIASLFEELSKRDVMLDMVSDSSSGRKHCLRFVVSEEDLLALEGALKQDEFTNALKWDVVCDLAEVSVVGSGFLSEAAILGSIHRALAQAGVVAIRTTVSALRVSLLIARDKEKVAVGAIHELIQQG